MSLGLSESRHRRRRQFWWRVTKFCLAFAVFIIIGVYSYLGGTKLAERKVTERDREIAALQGEIAALKRTQGDMEGRLQAATVSAQEWQASYQRDVPTGPIKDLITLLDDKLSDGTETDRLKFLISTAENPRDCEPEPLTRRFIVSTPLHKGANDAVSFARKTITVTASGPSAKDAQGRVEAWYDPQQQIKVAFTYLGGKTSLAEGLLPLHHAMVVGDSEYRFSVAPEKRGFVTVTGERCAYP